MEQSGNAEPLRSMAPHWSLAGDKQLLNILQDIHQKIMGRCHETKAKLEEMANMLDGANIDLQNVNNKFLALSNSQFIENRVYEDDMNSTGAEAQVKANSSQDFGQVHAESELTRMKEGLNILESMHECITILNSDSDSDTDDDEGRIVYKPKNLYNDRPLPHIIGSQAWKSKWHAGILVEDSDSDSSVAKPADAVMEQYSESDSEPTDTRTDQLHPPQRTSQMSLSSSMADSEPSVPPPPVSQAHIAAELARKLGGNILEIPIRTPEPEIPKPQAVPTKIYKPQNPPTSTIFFDEPPPPEQAYQSDNDDYNDEDDDEDIFANLHKRKPSFTKNKDQGRLNEELFGGLKGSHSVADDLFGVEQNDSRETANKEVNVEVLRESGKKPIGGVSLFGSSKDAESIGAVILKRNRIKTNSSDEDSEKAVFQNKPIKEVSKENVDTSRQTTGNVNSKGENHSRKLSEKHEKDILHDIFSKNKVSKPKVQDNQNTNQESKPKNNVIDLFSDNLFDDIDDIFVDNTNKVPSKKSTNNTKSIFDDEDDDLFADIAITKNKETSTKKTETPSLFDSDNDVDLFTDPIQSTSNAQTITGSKEHKTNTKIDTNNVKKSESKEIPSIFGEDSNDEIFYNHESNTAKDRNENFNVNKTEDKYNVNIDHDDDNNNKFSQMFSEANDAFTKDIKNIVNTGNRDIDNKATNIFNEPSCDSKNNLLTTHQTTYLANEDSPVLFDDEEYSDLFQNVPKISNRTEDNAGFHRDIENEKPSTENKEISDDVSTSVENKDEFPANSNIKVELDQNLLNDDYVEQVHEQVFQPEESDEAKEDTFEQISYEPDSFNDIFNDVPPAFEKPKESKKSKNINALFDDDSDDEALFFKKVDIISDEKPDLRLPAKEDNVFNIFGDEPPAMDCDFEQTSSENHIQPVNPKDLDPKDFNNPDPDLFNIAKQVTTSSQDECKNEVQNDLNNIDHTKPVGKLKPMNFNINVNTLLPGASPKKQKVTEEIDGIVASLPDTSNKTEVNESSLVRSISFEDEADSELLNNKLSKERAKIQVKRRPSTRKARREAVKKSGIDFGSNDITDNISSIDDPKATVVTEQVKSDKVLDKNLKEKDVKSKVVYILNDEDIFTNPKPDKTVEEIPKLKSIREDKNQHNPEKVSTREFDDDDDIFKIISSKVENPEANSSSQLITTDKVDSNSLIKPETNLKDSLTSKGSLFDDMSDEEAELFHSRKPVVAKKINLFGSDSEDDLFANSSKRVAGRKDEIQKTSNFKIEAKKSLFDDDSDNDLFKETGKSSDNKPLSLKQKQVKTVRTQAVNEDPLSLLSDDN